eukprot:TRINITY_DN18746_c0_g1_i1.p1 TRINITY_DN18746_c0_g1~~TRINITY_DN18746_c0_g1_i1.p1  ORF type:complete len:333 (+),score=29.74 TRINITY_DN18746_c0_g1_i1:134-1000(+)
MQGHSIAHRLQRITRGSAGVTAGGCAPPRRLQGGRSCSPAGRAGSPACRGGRVRSPVASPRSPRPRASPRVSGQHDVGVQTEGLDSIVEALQAKVAQLQQENERLQQLAVAAALPQAGLSQRRSPTAAEARHGVPASPVPSKPTGRLLWPWWYPRHDPEPPEHTKPERGFEPTGPRPGGPDWVREWLSPASSPLSEPAEWPPLALPPPQHRPRAAHRGAGARGVRFAAAAGARRSARGAAGAAAQPQPPAPAAEGPPPRVGPLGRLKAAWRRAFGGRSRGSATPVSQL